MAWDEVIAGLLGGLEGGVEGWQIGRKLKQQERERQALAARQAEEDAWRREQREQQRQDRAQQARDRERLATDQLLTNIGRGGVLTDEQAAGARDVGLGHRVEEAPDFQASYFTQAGPVPLMVPEVMSRVAPTGAERKADQAAAEKARVADVERQQLLKMISELPGHLQQPASFGLASGKMPTLGAADFVTPEERTDQEIAREVKKANALLPVKLRERAALDAAERRGKFDLPVKDDPALPRGVRAYLGDLVAKYQSDPAAARAELQRAAPNLLRDHPNLDLAKVTQQMNAMLPMPQLTDEEKEAAAAQRAGQKATTQVMTPDQRTPPTTMPMTPGKAQAPMAFAGAARPDARIAQAQALMKQIQQGRSAGQDTTALEQQLLALKVGAGAAR